MTWLKRIALALAVFIGAVFLWRYVLIVVAGVFAIGAGVYSRQRWHQWRNDLDSGRK